MKVSEEYISQLIAHFRAQGPVILLESQMKDHPSSSATYIAAQPKAWIKAWGGRTEVYSAGNLKSFQQNAWKALKDFRDDQQDWLFGYLGYELKNQLEDLQSKNHSLADVPDLFFMNPTFLVEIDMNEKLRVLKGNLPSVMKSYSQREVSVQPKKMISEEAYMDLVKQAKRDIYEGEYYEINLSHAMEFDFRGNSFDLYQAMREAGPVPFGSYMHLEELDICSASPERFLARNADRVWSQPIKGTASRDKESEKSLQALAESEKEQAENLMIVDLVRNDLNRVAINGTVAVSRLFEIQSFETVHQMVSTVECRVEDGMDSLDVVQACFPMGSMTGAPKIASMKAIEEYENYRRGIYSGAIGYFKPNGDFDFNVVIRTALIQENKLVYAVGGAITSDSDPAAEWEETLVKAKAITNVLEKVKKAE